MRRAVLALVIACGLATAAVAQQPPAVAGTRPACVAVTFAVRASGYAYNHLVTVHNGCRSPVACTVSTDVAPQPTRVTVAKDATETVTTFVGSPARTFIPTVNCTGG